jgi:hypothetical protein
MEKKFSTVITEQKGTYVAVLNCWTINEEGQRVTVDSKQFTGLHNNEAALEKAVEFYNKNKD